MKTTYEVFGLDVEQRDGVCENQACHNPRRGVAVDVEFRLNNIHTPAIRMCSQCLALLREGKEFC